MRVIFNPNIIFHRVQVTSDLKSLYESRIQSEIERRFNFLNLDKLKELIVPNNFIEDVINFQRINNIPHPSVTNNDHGRAYGKTIHVDSEDMFYVFVDPDLASFILDDSLITRLFANSDYGPGIQEIKSMGLNVIAHELSHVDMDSNVNEPVYDLKALEGVLTFTGIRMIEEYYACRKASSTFGEFSFCNSASGPTYVAGLENQIITDRKNYNLRILQLNDFITNFHTYSRMALIWLASDIGNSFYSDRYCISDISVKYEGCKIHPLITSISEILDELYREFLSTRVLNVSNELCDVINQYFEMFEVYLSQVSEGIYYDIPVRL